MKNTFPFDPARWLNNPALRICSLQARGLMADMLAIMASNGGRIPIIEGKKDSQVISALTGVDAADVSRLISELCTCKVLNYVNGFITSAAMVKLCEFRAKAKASGEEGARRKKAAKQSANPIPSNSTELENQ